MVYLKRGRVNTLTGWREARTLWFSHGFSPQTAVLVLLGPRGNLNSRVRWSQVVPSQFTLWSAFRLPSLSMEKFGFLHETMHAKFDDKLGLMDVYCYHRQVI